MLGPPVLPAGTAAAPDGRAPSDSIPPFGFGGVGGVTAAAAPGGPPGFEGAPAAAAPAGPQGGPDWLAGPFGGLGGAPAAAPPAGPPDGPDRFAGPFGGFGGATAAAPPGGPPGGPDRFAGLFGGLGGAPAAAPPGGPDRLADFGGGGPSDGPGRLADFGGGFGGLAPAAAPAGPPGGPDGLASSFGYGGVPAAVAKASPPGGNNGLANSYGFGGVPAAAAPAGPPGGGFGGVPMAQTSPAPGARGEGAPFGADGQDAFTARGGCPAGAPAAYRPKEEERSAPGIRRPATGIQGFTAPSLQQDPAGALPPPTTDGRGFLPAPAPAFASGTCHRCGQAGHWARDCPNAGAAAGAGGAAPGAGGAPLVEGPPCTCGAGPTLVRTATTAANSGRQFAKCPRSQGAGDNGCGFFQWLDEAGGPAAPPPAPVAEGPECPCGAGPSLVMTARSAANSGRQYAKCPKSENMPGKNGCGYFQWMDEIASGAPPPPPRPPPQEGPPCPCGAGPTQVHTARSAANSGRPYAKCPKSENVPGRNGCGFFQWMDEPQGGAGVAGAAAQQVQEGPDCPCGAGPTRVRTARTAANNGRQFASCPNNVPGGGNGCGFFQWMDEAAGGAAGGGGGAPAAPAQQAQPGPPCPCGAGPTQILTARSAANSGRQFAKCPKAGRTPGSDNGCGFFQWMDEAQDGGGAANQPGGAFAGGPAGGGFAGAGAGGRAGDECYKCGQVGHWASNCPNVDAAAPKGGGKGRGRKGGKGRGGKGRRGGGITEPGYGDEYQGFDPY